MKLSFIAALLLLCSSAMASVCSDAKREIAVGQKKSLKALQEKRINVDTYRSILDGGDQVVRVACSFEDVDMCEDFYRELDLAKNKAIKAMQDGRVSHETGEAALSNIESAREQTEDFCSNR